MESTGEYLYKTSCNECGSSDANAIYSDGGSHCFSCNHTIKGGDLKVSKGKREFNPSFLSYPNVIRGINKATLEKYTYGIDKNRHVTYYYDKEGAIVAEKYRDRDKQFGWSGNAKEAVLFGRHLWSPSKKIKLIITEGEIDAMSISHYNNDRYPVVSLPNGAASAKRDIKKNMEWILKFKEVILMFDNDKAGLQASKDVQGMFPPKFCKVAKIPLKDANEMLLAGRGKEINNAIFTAEAYVPEEIKSGDKLIELLDKVDLSEHYDFPNYVPNLTRKMRGMRIGDLTIITAGSGSGKTTFMKQLELHFYNTTNFNQGIIHLEENIRDTMEGLVSVALGRQLHLEDSTHTDKDVRNKWKELATAKDEEGNARFNIIDTFGSLDTERLYSMIRYLAQVEECKVIYLDHITMLVTGMEGNVDERRALDNVMTALKSLTQELNIHLFVVSHLNNSTNGGKAFENGGVATVNNLRGSGSLKQLADNVISLGRNQMAEDESERNTTIVSLLKCRKTGDTGITDKIRYDSSTGLFTDTFDDTEDSF